MLGSVELFWHPKANPICKMVLVISANLQGCFIDVLELLCDLS